MMNDTPSRWRTTRKVLACIFFVISALTLMTANIFGAAGFLMLAWLSNPRGE